MNRRKFMQGMLAGVASVAIATKIAPKFPELKEQSFPTGWTVTEDKIDDALYGDIGEHYAKALAKSMMQTKEQVAHNVLTKAFT